MRVPGSISVVWGTKIAFFSKAVIFRFKNHFSDYFFDDISAPAEGRRNIFPAGGRAQFGPRKIPAGGRDFFWTFPKALWVGGREGVTFFPWPPPRESIGVLNKRDGAKYIYIYIYWQNSKRYIYIYNDKARFSCF